jgi:hypothetical protein
MDVGALLWGEISCELLLLGQAPQPVFM